MPSDIPLSGEILTPDQVAKRQLSRAPVWLQKLASNSLAALAWIGLPSTVLSTLSNLRFIVDGAVYLYERAGVIQPALAWLGQAISFVVQVWRSLTHPIWDALGELLRWTLPDWAPDALTLVALFCIGMFRRWAIAYWGESFSQAVLLCMAADDNRVRDNDVRIPRAFPYAAYFEEFGVRMRGVRLRDARRLWRKWRSRQIQGVLWHHQAEWPRFPDAVVRAQFGRYWQAVQDGRRDLCLYSAGALLLLVAYAVDFLMQA